MNKKDIKKGLIPYVALLVIIAGIIIFSNFANKKVNELNYSEFINSIEEKKITKMEVTPREGQGVYIVTGKMDGYGDHETFAVKVPLSDEVIKKILDANAENSFELITNSDPDGNSFLIVLLNILPIIVIAGGGFYLLTRQLNSNNKSFDFGKNQAKLNTEKGTITFNDVAGLKEEKEEVKELIDFLKSPKKFQKLGARIPKGVLLVGPPGTGKTLLARAVAGEANVPFYYISGSEFVELFVGVGASRVRNMFKEAKHNAPCLIFIDEIDAVGRQRGTGLGGGHDEREQTLNQLLTEMDGFGANEGIIVIAATNRSDVLDPALLRPGRFDRQVTVGMPDIAEREEILKVHSGNKVLASGIDLKNIAKRTPGFSGADLENLMNEAALLAVRRNKDKIGLSEIDEGIDRVIGGPAKVTRKYTEKEKRMVAYHEAGHAVIGVKLDDAYDVQKITIVPRGNAGGYNLMTPREEKFFSTKKELLDRVTGLLAGRVSEEINFKEVTTGAYGDFAEATKIARRMVTEYGMSELGPVQFEHPEGSVFLGRDYASSKNFSNEVAHEIDIEVRKIINTCYELATKTLTDNKKLLDLIAETLLERETITKEEIETLISGKKLAPMEDEVVSEEPTLDELKKQAKEKKIKGYSKMKKDELKEELNK